LRSKLRPRGQHLRHGGYPHLLRKHSRLYSNTWDAAGDLAIRADTFEGYTENFCFDAQVDITSKSDMGT
jgi:hypothetical protein